MKTHKVNYIKLYYIKRSKIDTNNIFFYNSVIHTTNKMIHSLIDIDAN